MTQRSRRAVLNIGSTLGLQLVSVICGMIVPRLMLGAFGSEANGTVSSINNFLSYIALLESGVGGVVTAALYKPLAEKNTEKISAILKATQDFFNKIAGIFLVYMAVLAVFFPYFVDSSFSWGYSASLVIIIGVSTLAQYYFGLSYQLLLRAGQKNYIFCGSQIGAILLNTLVIFILVKLNCSLHMVRLGSSLVYVLRPLILSAYANSAYKIDRKAAPDQEAIAQRWDGFGQHIAFFIHNNTDVTVLSLFTNLLEVSVYSVHFMIVSGISSIVSSVSVGFSAAIGDMIAREEHKTLNNTVDIFEFATFFLTSVFFTITALMIEPFVALYTEGIQDVNYCRPLFAWVMCAAEGMCAVRNIYSTIVLNAGHYRQTSRGAYLEAAINMILSVLFVKLWGLVGVAVGTLIAMTYRTVDYVLYLRKNIMFRSAGKFVKSILVNGAAISVSVLTVKFLVRFPIHDWLHWILAAVVTSVIVIVSFAALDSAFYQEESRVFWGRLRAGILKRGKR